MKSYLRRDNRARSSSIRWNQKTGKGTQKRREKQNTKETQCERREEKRPGGNMGLIITAKEAAD